MRLIDSDALKKDIEKQAVLLKIMFGDDEDMMKLITELYKGFMAQIDKMQTIKKPEWIPVTERLPDNGKEVLVTAWEDTVDVAWRHLDGNWVSGFCNFDDGDVRAWMPKPKPYEYPPKDFMNPPERSEDVEL